MNRTDELWQRAPLAGLCIECKRRRATWKYQFSTTESGPDGRHLVSINLRHLCDECVAEQLTS